MPIPRRRPRTGCTDNSADANGTCGHSKADAQRSRLESSWGRSTTDVSSARQNPTCGHSLMRSAARRHLKIEPPEVPASPNSAKPQLPRSIPPTKISAARSRYTGQVVSRAGTRTSPGTRSRSFPRGRNHTPTPLLNPRSALAKRVGRTLHARHPLCRPSPSQPNGPFGSKTSPPAFRLRVLTSWR